MALSRLAREFAAEIANHDWSDAPYRADRAGHDRTKDRTSSEQLSPGSTNCLRLNVMWVTAQVLGHADPNFNVYEFADACGIEIKTQHGQLNGMIECGVRQVNGRYCRPGTCDAPID